MWKIFKPREPEDTVFIVHGSKYSGFEHKTVHVKWYCGRAYAISLVNTAELLPNGKLADGPLFWISWKPCTSLTQKLFLGLMEKPAISVEDHPDDKTDKKQKSIGYYLPKDIPPPKDSKVQKWITASFGFEITGVIPADGIAIPKQGTAKMFNVVATDTQELRNMVTKKINECIRSWKVNETIWGGDVKSTTHN